MSPPDSKAPGGGGADVEWEGGGRPSSAPAHRGGGGDGVAREGQGGPIVPRLALGHVGKRAKDGEKDAGHGVSGASRGRGAVAAAAAAGRAPRDVKPGAMESVKHGGGERRASAAGGGGGWGGVGGRGGERRAANGGGQTVTDEVGCLF